jgi:hypothetical protein
MNAKSHSQAAWRNWFGCGTSSPKRKFSKQRRFQMERLEDRQMMAGDVAASVKNGTLSIEEAPNSIGGAQHFEIVQLATNKVRLVGSAGTKINGNNSAVFQFSGGLNIARSSSGTWSHGGCSDGPPARRKTTVLELACGLHFYLPVTTHPQSQRRPLSSRSQPHVLERRWPTFL